MTKAASTFSVIGSFAGEFGVGQHARVVATSLDSAGVDYSLINTKLGPHLHNNSEFAERFSDENGNSINLLCFNVFDLPAVIQDIGVASLEDKFNISYGYWEFDTVPSSWSKYFSLYDEYWAPTKFIAEAFKKATDRPVIHMPLAVYLPAIPKLSRAHFGLPADSFLFLFHFDGHSYPARKNPYAAIRAFKHAFAGSSARVALVIKSKNLPPAEIERLKDVIEGDERIVVLLADWTKPEVTALESLCDAYVSLHRSEGFGLGPAEMMLLGKPVIVTNYSGNTDFTLESNSLLVDYEIVPVREGEYMFFEEGQVWAEPDVEHAAKHMQDVYEDSSLRKRIGTAASAFMKEHHGPEVCGAAYARRLAILSNELPEKVLSEK